MESPIQIQCTIMHGGDSCLERCRASDKLHRNFVVCMFLAEEHCRPHRSAACYPPQPAPVGSCSPPSSLFPACRSSKHAVSLRPRLPLHDHSVHTFYLRRQTRPRDLQAHRVGSCVSPHASLKARAPRNRLYKGHPCCGSPEPSDIPRRWLSIKRGPPSVAGPSLLCQRSPIPRS